MSWVCEKCGASVNELRQCECCQIIVCTKCYDPFAGSCIGCVADLLQNKRKCGICRLTQPLNYLWECPYCRRRICISHLAERQEVCDDCIAEFEQMPDFPEKIEECTHCGAPMLVDATTTKYYDHDGNLICPLCTDEEAKEICEEDEDNEES